MFDKICYSFKILSWSLPTCVIRGVDKFSICQPKNEFIVQRLSPFYFMDM